MKKENRKCWKCKRIIFYVVPVGVIGGLIREVKDVKKRPYLYRENHYWCEECWNKYRSKAG